MVSGGWVYLHVFLPPLFVSSKENNFCDFPFVSLLEKAFLKKDQCFAPREANAVLYMLTSIEKGSKNKMEDLLPLKVYPFNLRLRLIR